MSRKVAFVTGATGQDGSYLCEQLLYKGYEVHGLIRPRGHRDYGALKYAMPKVVDRIHWVVGDVTDPISVLEAIRSRQPTEVYHLAAQTFVGADSTNLNYSVNHFGTANVLEAVRIGFPEARVYFAGTSEMFGNNGCDGNVESSPMCPQSTYGFAKKAAYELCTYYRDGYGLFVSCGFLHNHESERRGERFVTRKVAIAAAEFAAGRPSTDKMKIGNISAKRDWGYAPEYTDAMWRMLQQDKPDDYVVATGETHSVENLLTTMFSIAGLGDWRNYAEISEEHMRRREVHVLRGNPLRAKIMLGWVPQTKFLDLCGIMVATELERYGVLNHGEVASNLARLM